MSNSELETSGMLDQSADNVDLKQGSKVELPFWMVPTLHSKKIITFEIPRYYKVNYRYTTMSIIRVFPAIICLNSRQILKADSFVVDLHKWGPHFYDLGLHVANLALKESPDIKNCLIDVCSFWNSIFRKLTLSLYSRFSFNFADTTEPFKANHGHFATFHPARNSSVDSTFG